MPAMIYTTGAIAKHEMIVLIAISRMFNKPPLPRFAVSLPPVWAPCVLIWGKGYTSTYHKQAQTVNRLKIFL